MKGGGREEGHDEAQLRTLLRRKEAKTAENEVLPLFLKRKGFAEEERELKKEKEEGGYLLLFLFRFKWLTAPFFFFHLCLRFPGSHAPAFALLSALLLFSAGSLFFFIVSLFLCLVVVWFWDLAVLLVLLFFPTLERFCKGSLSLCAYVRL
jgi:hypothetical protein